MLYVSRRRTTYAQKDRANIVYTTVIASDVTIFKIVQPEYT